MATHSTEQYDVSTSISESNISGGCLDRRVLRCQLSSTSTATLPLQGAIDRQLCYIQRFDELILLSWVIFDCYKAANEPDLELHSHHAYPSRV